MLTVWLATLAAEKPLSSPAYLIPFGICVGILVLGGLVLIVAAFRVLTRYERLKRLYKVGKRLRRMFRWHRPWRIRDPILRIAWQVNEAARWTTSVEREIENIAPKFLSRWYGAIASIDRAPAPKMVDRLRVLDGIMAQVRAEDGS